jgi:hypothetical protein
MNPSPWLFYIQVKGPSIHTPDDAVLPFGAAWWLRRKQSISTLQGIEKQFLGFPAPSVVIVPSEQETQQCIY